MAKLFYNLGYFGISRIQFDLCDDFSTAEIFVEGSGSLIYQISSRNVYAIDATSPIPSRLYTGHRPLPYQGPISTEAPTFRFPLPTRRKEMEWLAADANEFIRILGIATRDEIQEAIEQGAFLTYHPGPDTKWTILWDNYFNRYWASKNNERTTVEFRRRVFLSYGYGY